MNLTGGLAWGGGVVRLRSLTMARPFPRVIGRAQPEAIQNLAPLLIRN